jgi:AsmA family protein
MAVPTIAAMRSPLAAWHAGVRWPLALISAFVALLAIVLVCEAIGWPFLVGPVQDRLAQLLDRRVVFASGSGGSGVRIGLLGSVRVRAESIEIGAPQWSPARHTLLARDAALKLGYLDLWRAYRGGTLHIRELEAGELDAILERRTDGRASWQFGSRQKDDAAKEEASLPTFGRLAVGDGHVLYLDQVLPAGVDARFSLVDRSAGGPAVVPSVAGDASSAPASAVAASDAASRGIVIRAGGAASGAPPTAANVRLAPGETGLRLKATGQYKKLPVRIDLRTAGVLGFLDEGDGAKAQPLSLRAIIGRAEVAFDGTTRDPLHFTGLKGRFRLAGDSLAAVGDALGITLPTTPPFTTHGTLVKDADVWKAVFDAASIGSSRLNGAFTYDKRPKVPLLAGRLGGSRLVLADLGPAVGTPPPGSGAAKANAATGGRVIPDKKFDLPSLRAMNANVVVAIGVFDPGTDILEPLHPTRAHLLLADGVLTIADFEGVTAQGKLAGYLQLDGRGEKALWTADLRLLGVNLAHWLRLKRSGDAPPYLTGKLDALVKVKGSGRSTAEILGSLGGDIRMHMRDAAVSHLAVEVGGIDVAQALGMLVKGDEALPILCNVADLDVAQGIARPKVFVLNTRDSTIWIDGTVSLRDETLDLRAVVSPKDFSPMTLRTPVHVKGTFGNPKVSVEMGKLAGKAGAAGLLALLHPLAAIIPFIDPGAQKEAAQTDAECANLVRTSGVIPGAVRNPKSTRMPPAPAASAASAVGSATAASAVRR